MGGPGGTPEARETGPLPGADVEPGPRHDAEFWRRLDRRRTAYYILFFAIIAGNIGSFFIRGRPDYFGLWAVPYYLVVAAFLVIFLSTAGRLGYSGGSLLGIAILILLPLPLVPIITIALVDRRMGDLIDSQRGGDPGRARAAEQPRTEPMAYWSLILFLFPYVGLPLAAIALSKIRRSGGTLKGTGLAWAGIALNSLALVLVVAFAIRFSAS